MYLFNFIFLSWVISSSWTWRNILLKTFTKKYITICQGKSKRKNPKHLGIGESKGYSPSLLSYALISSIKIIFLKCQSNPGFFWSRIRAPFFSQLTWLPTFSLFFVSPQTHTWKRHILTKDKRFFFLSINFFIIFL